MAFPDLSREDRLVQKMFAEHLQNALGWVSVFAWNTERFGLDAPPRDAKVAAFPSRQGIPRLTVTWCQLAFSSGFWP